MNVIRNVNPQLDCTFKWAQWKTDVVRELASLQTRVALLEREASKRLVSYSLNEGQNHELKTSTQNLSESAGGAKSFTDRLKTQRAARFQCCWLLICIIFFLYFAVNQLIEADLNEKSQWKPEWKRYVLDYNSPGEQYKMPYLWLQFFLQPENETGSDGVDVDETIAQVLNSSFLGETRLTFLRSNFSWGRDKQEIEEAVGFYSGSSFGGIGVLIRLTLADPGAFFENWQTILQVNIPSLSFNETYSMTHLKLKVGRTMEKDLTLYEFIDYDSNWTNFEDEAHQMFVIEYSEKVTKKYRSTEEVGIIESELTQTLWPSAEETYSIAGIEVEKGDLVFSFKPDLSVEHWEEYVAFGYWDWLTGMGGIFSLMSTIFFWFAYYLAKLTDPDGVGILPEMSFVFANFETIRGIQCPELNHGGGMQDHEDLILAS